MKQEEMFIIAAHSFSPSCSIVFAAGKEKEWILILFCLNIPCLVTMQISSLLCMLIMVNSKMLIEK